MDVGGPPMPLLGKSGHIAATLSRAQLRQRAAQYLALAAYGQAIQIVYPIAAFLSITRGDLVNFTQGRMVFLVHLALPMMLLLPLAPALLLLRRRVRNDWRLEGHTSVLLWAFRANGLAVTFSMVSMTMYQLLFVQVDPANLLGPFPRSPHGAALLLIYLVAACWTFVCAASIYQAKLFLDALPFAPRRQRPKRI